MTQESYREHTQLNDIVAADESSPSLLRQLGNGIGGLVTLMVGGILVMLLVLWKAP